jgi:hypothetical protein
VGAFIGVKHKDGVVNMRVIRISEKEVILQGVNNFEKGNTVTVSSMSTFEAEVRSVDKKRGKIKLHPVGPADEFTITVSVV